MNKIIPSLVIFTGTTASLLIGTNSALAASFNWSYETTEGNIYTGMLEGDVEPDGNTINVTSVFMSQLNGIDLLATPIIRNSAGLLSSMGIVTLNGTTMDLGACQTPDCLSGIFIGNLGFPDSTFFSTSSEFGNDFENFNAGNWNIEEKTIVSVPVPEPSLTLALLGLGLSGLVKISIKKD
ncbi:MAG: PEP-CTERM sorting domain-containing protein [Crocosphaera sp.]|nr:PEP-CTERM sorting domain-containing protein [Crocosphaera sp.]